MNYLNFSIVCGSIIISYLTIVSSQEENLLETEGLMPLSNSQNRYTNQKRYKRSLPDNDNMLESESLLPFDQELLRYKRADNVEGSGGEPSTRAPATITCHELTCSGTACLTAFNTSDTSKQCRSTGSCYIRARGNTTVQTVEARCDTRLECEWQVITLNEVTEVSNCCNDNLCNTISLISQNHGATFHTNTPYQFMFALLTVTFVYLRYHANLLL